MRSRVEPGDHSPGRLCDIINEGRKVVNKLRVENEELRKEHENCDKQAETISEIRKRCIELGSQYQDCKNGDEAQWPQLTPRDVEIKITSFGDELKNWARRYNCKATMRQALADDPRRKLLFQRVEPFTLLQNDSLPIPFKSLASEFMAEKACRTLLEGLVTHRVFKALLNDPFYMFNPPSMEHESTPEKGVNAFSTAFKMMRLHDTSSANAWRWKTFRSLDPKLAPEGPGQEEEIRKNVRRRETKHRTWKIVEAAAHAVADSTVRSAVGLLINPEDLEGATVKLKKIAEDIAQQAYIWATSRIEIRVWDRECLREELPKPYYSGCSEFLTNDEAHTVELDKSETALDRRQVAVIVNPAVVVFWSNGDPKTICYTDDHRTIPYKAKVLYEDLSLESDSSTYIPSKSNGHAQSPFSPPLDDQEPDSREPDNQESHGRRAPSHQDGDLHKKVGNPRLISLWLEDIQTKINEWGRKHCDVDTFLTTLNNPNSRAHLVDSVKDFVRLDSGDLPQGLHSATEKTSAMLLIGLASHHIIGQPFGDPFFFEPDRYKRGLSDMLARLESGHYAKAQVWRAQTLCMLNPVLREDEEDYEDRRHEQSMLRLAVDHTAGLITETIMLTATDALLTNARRVEARAELLRIAKRASCSAFNLWTYKTRIQVCGLELLHLMNDGVNSYPEVVKEFPFYTRKTRLRGVESNIAMCVSPGISLIGDGYGADFSAETIKVLTKAAIWIDRPDVQNTYDGTYSEQSDSDDDDDDIPPSDDGNGSSNNPNDSDDDDDVPPSDDRNGSSNDPSTTSDEPNGSGSNPIRITEEPNGSSNNPIEISEVPNGSSNSYHGISDEESATRKTNQAGPENMNQAGPENTNQHEPESTNQAEPESTNQAEGETTNQAGAENMNQAEPETTNQAGTETTNQAGAEALVETLIGISLDNDGIV